MNHQHQQGHISPLGVTVINHSDESIIAVDVGRDLTVLFRRARIVMIEVNGLQFAPLGVDVRSDWFKSLQVGGLEPVLKDYVEIEKMVMNYLFDAAIKTRLGESA